MRGRGRNGHRGRDVDDRKTKIRNSNLSREQLISRTSPFLPSPPPLRASPTSPHPPLLPMANGTVSLRRWRRPPCRRLRRTRARAVLTFLRPEIPTVIGRQDRAFNRRNRIAKLERCFQGENGVSSRHSMFPSRTFRSTLPEIPSACSRKYAVYLNCMIRTVAERRTRTRIPLVPPQLTRRQSRVCICVCRYIARHHAVRKTGPKGNARVRKEKTCSLRR